MTVFIKLTKVVSQNKVAIPVDEVEMYEEIDELLKGENIKVVKIHFDGDNWIKVIEDFDTVDKLVYDGVKLSQPS